MAIPRHHHQTPLIDADGNGIGNEKSDRPAANNTWIGYQVVSAAEFPEIISVSPAQVLTDETTATIFAEGVTGDTAITRVWATVLRPDFDPGPPDDPVTYLPEVDLIHVGNSRYEGRIIISISMVDVLLRSVQKTRMILFPNLGKYRCLRTSFLVTSMGILMWI